MAVKINKLWDCASDHRATDADGGRYSVSELIHKSKGLPTLEIPLDHLYIGYGLGEMDLRKLVSHMKMTIEADMDYPIILDPDGTIMDGRHRVARALLEGRETIKAVRLVDMPPPVPTSD